MTIIFQTVFGSVEDWVGELTTGLPGQDIRVYPDVGDPSEVEFVIMWSIPQAELATFVNLKAILLTGAGGNHLRPVETLPDVPIVRLADQTVARDMANFALYWVMHYHRRIDAYQRQQADSLWNRLDSVATSRFCVGVLGMGNIGGAVADAALALGYSVRGWSRSGRERAGVASFGGDDLDAFLAECDALVNVLPLTADTRKILDADRLALLPEGACVINVGRGGTVDDDALIAALDSGHLRGAALDVFRGEPLGAESPMWSHPLVEVTPHISGSTYPSTAAPYIYENIKRMQAGEAPFPIFDRHAGY